MEEVEEVKQSRERGRMEEVKQCKVVLVGDSECGKTALLNVFTKDRFPQRYAPTVFENYTASLELERHRVELRLWDTSGSRYYDNVRPLSYPDADAVLICFDISRPETLDNVLKKWVSEVQEFCPDSQRLLVGCKLDLRTDLFSPSREPVSYNQGSRVAQLLSAPYLECSSLQSESSIRDLFNMAALACVSKKSLGAKRRRSRARQRTAHSGDSSSSSLRYQQTKAKSCSVM